MSDIARLVQSWQGPDPTLRQVCECKHNLAQHSYSRGPCSYRDSGCDCSRFTRVQDGAR